MTTVRDLLRDAGAQLVASGSPSPRLDAELLLGSAIGADRTAILAHPEAPVGADAEAAFRAGVARRVTGEPVAYIRGFKEFHGLAFSVDPRALIPRPETERLVDLAIEAVMRRLAGGVRPPGTPLLRVADIGTGSGAIAIALIAALRARGAAAEVTVTATDLSPDALDLARENAAAHAVADHLAFDLVDLLPDGVARFDLILANLPYVRRDVVPDLPRAASFEPAVALDGGEDGLAVIGALLDRLPIVLVTDGTALLEIGADQADAIATLARERLPGWRCAVETDLAGLPRVARLEPSSGTGG